MMSINIANIDNFLALPPRFATAGQPQREQFASIAAAGYTTIVNLARADSPHALADEPEIVAALGLEYFNIPVDFTAPTLADFQQFVEIMTARLDRQIFIHCAANKRVSAFMYLYRLFYENVPESIAITDLTAIWEPNDIWQQFIDRVKSQSRSRFWMLGFASSACLDQNARRGSELDRAEESLHMCFTQDNLDVRFGRNCQLLAPIAATIAQCVTCRWRSLAFGDRVNCQLI